MEQGYIYLIQLIYSSLVHIAIWIAAMVAPMPILRLFRLFVAWLFTMLGVYALVTSGVFSQGVCAWLAFYALFVVPLISVYYVWSDSLKELFKDLD